MPQGVMQWFDARFGEGRVLASGHEYPVYEREVEPRARKARARVRFDIERIDGVRTAVRVRLRPGTRSSPTQRRVGDLAGAGRPEEKRRVALTRQRTGVDFMPARPGALVRRWVAAANSGHLDAVMPLYAPNVVLHGPDGDRRGRAAIRAYLLDSGLLSPGWDTTLQGMGDTVLVSRGPSAPDRGATSRFRIAYGQIAEQWVENATQAGGPG